MEMALRSTKATLKNKKGLTLIELLAILVIIGIVAAIAIPAINATIHRSENKADKASQQIIIDAATRYAIEEHLGSNSGAALSRTVAQLVADGYLNALPTWNTSTHEITSVTITVNATTGAVTVALLPTTAIVS